MYEASGQATELDLCKYEDRKITKNTFLDDSFRKNRESARRNGKTQQEGAGHQGTYEAGGVRACTRLGARVVRTSRACTRMEARGGRTPGRPLTSSRPGLAGCQEIRGGGAGRQDTRVPTDFYQAGTKQTDFYQAGTETGVKKPGRGWGRQKRGREYNGCSINAI